MFSNILKAAAEQLFGVVSVSETPTPTPTPTMMMTPTPTPTPTPSMSASPTPIATPTPAHALGTLIVGAVALLLLLIAIYFIRKIWSYLTWLGVKMVTMIEVWFYLVLFVAFTYVVAIYAGGSSGVLKDFHHEIQALFTRGFVDGQRAWLWIKALKSTLF